jgi:hypothetical protein
VQLTLNQRGPFGGGGGGGGSNPPPTTFPPPVTPPPTHFYTGDFIIYGDTITGDGLSQAATNATFTAGQLYNYSIHVIFTDAGTYAHHVALQADFTVTFLLNLTATDMPDGAGDWTFTGSFTPSGPDAGSNPFRMMGGTAVSPHGHLPAGTVSFVIDPDGWDPGGDPVPPSPGQVNARPEVVTMSGADGTTLWPFADGTLKVFDDNTDQTGAIIAQDGSAGTFTLGFTPWPGEVITVEYLGR